MASPVVSQELLQLTSQGIEAASIKFKNVTMQSSRWVCVKEEGKNSVCILDTANKTFVRLPVNADSAIMSPTERVLAVRSGLSIQLFNLDLKTRLKAASMPAEVVFWKFLDPHTIVLVTAQHVYHWPVQGENGPLKIFDRQPHSGVVQIINYRMSADAKWHILGGITVTPTGGVAGVLQVYSADMRASQPQMDALAACFASVVVDGRSVPSTLFCFTKHHEQGLKVTAIEVGVPKEHAFTQSGIVKLPPGDFPVGMLSDARNGMIFLVTKLGILAMVDVQSGQCVYSTQASANTMFLQIESEAPEGGIVTVDQTGRVVHHFVDEQRLLAYVNDILGNSELAAAMARRRGVQIPSRAEPELDFSGFAKEEPLGKNTDIFLDAVAVRKAESLSGPPADPFAVMAEGTHPRSSGFGSPFSPSSALSSPSVTPRASNATLSSPSPSITFLQQQPSPSVAPLPPPRASVPPIPRSPAFSPSTIVDFDDNSIISVGDLEPAPLGQERNHSPKLDGLFSSHSSPAPSQPHGDLHSSQPQAQPHQAPAPPPPHVYVDPTKSYSVSQANIISLPSSPLSVHKQSTSDNNFAHGEDKSHNNENRNAHLSSQTNGYEAVASPSLASFSPPSSSAPPSSVSAPSSTSVPPPSRGSGFRLENLTVTEVSEWLSANKLGQYAESFANMQIDGRALSALAVGARQSVIAVVGFLKQLDILVPGHALTLVSLLLEQSE